ncbi:MAG: biotin carboxylase N-terminal domain-containing protein [bacterium]
MESTEHKRPTLDNSSRIGIINRGEAAIRFIRAVREYNALYHTSLTTVAFYLDIEQESLFVKEADDVYPLSKITRLHQGAWVSLSQPGADAGSTSVRPLPGGLGRMGISG